MQKTTYIPVYSTAPAKPAWGQPCNGCGVCCLSEPCPVGMVLSRRRHGACQALQWNGSTEQYRCGALEAPDQVVRQALPSWLFWTSPLWTGLLRWRGARWIAAGVGCDCSFEVQSKPPAA